MNFDGDLSLLQRKMAASSAGVQRRQAVMEALNVRSGQSILDLGCGGGHLVEELARAVGPQGKAFGLDPSKTQIQAARERCNHFDQATFFCCMADEIALNATSCDAVVSIQTLEYIEDVDAALSAVIPLLKTQSKFVNISILWDHFKFHGADEALNTLIFDAFRAHCFHQMLPMELPGKLAKLAIRDIHTRSLAFVITQRHDNSPARFAEAVMANFALRQGVAEDKVRDWQTQLSEAEKQGRFGFASFPVLTSGTLT